MWINHASVETYRSRAEEIVQSDLTLPEDVAHSPHEVATQNLNLLKFSLYIDEWIDSLTHNQAINWINEHLRFTQIFLNELGADLIESNSTSPEMTRAIKDYLGISVQVNEHRVDGDHVHFVPLNVVVVEWPTHTRIIERETVREVRVPWDIVYEEVDVIPAVRHILDQLSVEMERTPRSRQKVRDLLDRIKDEDISAYRLFQNDRNSLVYEASEYLNDLRNENHNIEIPAYMLGNKDLLSHLQPYWQIEWGFFVPKNEQVKKDFAEFKDLMSFIENTPRDNTGIIDKQWLMERYLKILDPTNTRFIQKARFLEIMYAEALYEDLLKQGYVLRKDRANGGYDIIRPNSKTQTGSTTKEYTEERLSDIDSDHPYLRLVGETEVRRMMDVMALNSIISRDSLYDDLEVVGQDIMIQRILSEHRIMWPDWRSIQKAKLLVIDWNEGDPSIKEQIEARRLEVLDTPNFQQSYLELQYLIDFFEDRDYLNPDGNFHLFEQANLYRKAYLAEQAYLKMTNAGENASSNPLDFIEKFAEENQVKAFLASIVLFLTGNGKLGTGTLLFSIFWGSLAWAWSDVIEGWKQTVQRLTKKDLGILDPRDIRYDISTPLWMDEADIQKTLDKLYAANDLIRNGEGVDDSRALTYAVSNAALAKVVGEILQHDTLLDKAFSTNSNTAEEIHTTINTDISATSFDSRLPDTEGWNVSLDDVKAVLALMWKNIKEGGDETIADVIYEWRDPKNEAYVPINFGFEGESAGVFNTELNNTFTLARTAIQVDGDRKDIARLQSVKKTISATLGWENPITDPDSNVGIRARSMFLLSEAWEIQEVIQKISIIRDEELTFNGKNYKEEIVAALKKYKDYIDVDVTLTEYDGFGARVEEGATAALGRLAEYEEKFIWFRTVPNIEEARNAIIDIDKDLENLGIITAVRVQNSSSTVNINSDVRYTPLLRRFNRISSQLLAKKAWFEAMEQGADDAMYAQLDALNQGREILELSPTEKRILIENFSGWDRDKLGIILSDFVWLARTLKKWASDPATDLSRFVETYWSAYNKLSWTHSALISIQTPLDAMQSRIISEVGTSLTIDGQAVKSKIEDELTRAFRTQALLFERITSINPATTSIVSTGTSSTVSRIPSTTMRNTVTEIQDIRTTIQNNIPWTNITLSMDGSSVVKSDAETAFEKAQKYFWTSFAIPDVDKTNAKIFWELRTRSEQFTNNIRAEIVSPTISLERLVTLYESNVIDFVESEYPNLGIKKSVQRSIEGKIITEIDALTTVEDTIEFMEWDFEKARSVFEWSIDSQPTELLEKLPMDKKLAEKLKDNLEKEIADLKLDTDWLKAAEKLAENMEWKSARTSVLGGWRTTIAKNATEFTWLFDGAGKPEGKFKKRLEEIRERVMKERLQTTPVPRPTYLYPKIEAAMSAHAGSLITPTLWGRVESDRDAMTLSRIYTKYGEVSSEVKKAFHDEYLID